MIRSFRSAALQRFWEKRTAVERILTGWVLRIEQILEALDRASEPEDLALPGFGFHSYAEGRQPRYGVMVSAVWRISFTWKDKSAWDVELEETG